MIDPNFEIWMRLALNEARKGAGMVSPNPLVGAIIVKNNRVIATGYHHKFGDLHAETDAISQTDCDLSGATLVVNLEPCCHTGKQPPCVEAIIKNNFARVIVGMADPNPLVAGKGIEILRGAGVEVISDVLRDECLELNRFFVKSFLDSRPYVIGKAATSLDGCIATADNDSRWISCEESRRRVHLLRSQVDAVLIGRGTAQADNPSLTVRSVPGRSPKRIILDSNLSLPENLNIFNDEFADNTFIVCKNEVLNAKPIPSHYQRVRLIGAETNRATGKIDLRQLFGRLWSEYKINSVLAEGGGKLFSDLIREDLFDEFRLYIAPIFLGEGIQLAGDLKVDKVADAKKYNTYNIEKSGIDTEIILHNYQQLTGTV